MDQGSGATLDSSDASGFLHSALIFFAWSLEEIVNTPPFRVLILSSVDPRKAEKLKVILADVYTPININRTHQ